MRSIKILSSCFSITTTRLRAIWILPVAMLSGCEMSKEDEQKYGMQLRAERIIRGALKDPDSVKFENTTYSADPPTVCGEFNARNGFGGYAGSTRYIYSGSGISVQGYDKNFEVKAVDCIGTRPIYEHQ